MTTKRLVLAVLTLGVLVAAAQSCLAAVSDTLSISGFTEGGLYSDTITVDENDPNFPEPGVFFSHTSGNLSLFGRPVIFSENPFPSADGTFLSAADLIPLIHAGTLVVSDVVGVGFQNAQHNLAFWSDGDSASDPTSALLGSFGVNASDPLSGAFVFNEPADLFDLLHNKLLPLPYVDLASPASPHITVATFQSDGDTNTVPEPASLIVWSLIGLSMGVAGWRRRRKLAA